MFYSKRTKAFPRVAWSSLYKVWGCYQLVTEHEIFLWSGDPGLCRWPRECYEIPLRREDNKARMMPLATFPNKHKSTPPTKEKDEKKNIVTRINPSNKYQYIFLGYFYSYNNFGHNLVHCKSYRRCNPKNVQRSQKINTKKRNYNLFSPLQYYNMECLKCNNYGHEASECRLSKYFNEINIPNNQKVWKKKKLEKTECKVALYVKNKGCQWYIYIYSGYSKHINGDQRKFLKLMKKEK
jgi:hypothetical protein